MARRSRRSRARARQKTAGDASINPLLARIWSQAIQAQSVGILLGVAGLILVITPLLRRPDKASDALVAGSWWTSAFYAPDVLGVAAALSAVALILLAGILWTRVEFAKHAPKKDALPAQEPAADFEYRRAPVPDEVDDLAERSRRAVFPWVGAACLLVGAAILLGEWFVAQQELPPAHVAIANGETIEHYTLPQASASLKVNLPRRVRLQELQSGVEPSAAIQIFQVGDDPASPPSVRRTLPAGTGVDFNGLRITFSGVRPSEDKLRATFASTEPDSVGATASIGKKFRLSLDGPEFRLLDVRENYLDVMGPAAELESDELGKFWVFARNSQTSVPPDLGHPIRLERVESEMAGIFTVTAVRPFWPISLGGTLFVLGFSLLIIFPERIVRRDESGNIRLWSFHEAGDLADSVVEDAAHETVKTKKNLLRAAVGAGWAGLLIVAIGIYTGTFSSLNALIATGAFAGLAAFPMTLDLRKTSGLPVAIGALVPLAIGVLSLVVAIDIAGEPADAMLLYAGQWAAFCAALTAALIAGAFGASSRLREVPGEAQRLGLHARDFALRAVLLGWLGWLVLILIRWREIGAVSLASPADWTLVGALLLASATLLIFWSKRRAYYALIFVLYVAALGLGIYFGAPFGLAI